VTLDKSFSKMTGREKNMFPKLICTCDESPVIIRKIRVVVVLQWRGEWDLK